MIDRRSRRTSVSSPDGGTAVGCSDVVRLALVRLPTSAPAAFEGSGATARRTPQAMHRRTRRR
jgi:hypothetical protein